MKTILCYGDSNTYGYDPRNQGRYPKELRWTTILQKLIGEDYDVIPEGLNGRTTAYDRDGEDIKNGLTHMDAIINSHRPIDILIFMLGVNDCNADMNLSVEQISDGMEKLIVEANRDLLSKQNYLPKIVLIAPAHIGDEYKHSPLAYQLDDASIVKSHQVPAYYEKLAEKYNCIYLDGSKFLKASELDAEHLTIESHQLLAEKLADIIKEI